MPGITTDVIGAIILPDTIAFNEQRGFAFQRTAVCHTYHCCTYSVVAVSTAGSCAASHQDHRRERTQANWSFVKHAAPPCTPTQHLLITAANTERHREVAKRSAVYVGYSEHQLMQPRSKGGLTFPSLSPATSSCTGPRIFAR